MMTEQDGTRIEISAADVKNKQQLMHELQSFAGLLWRSLDTSKRTGTIVLTFKREEAHEFALTLYQLLGVLKQHKDN